MNSVLHGFEKITEVSGTDDQPAAAVQKVYDEILTTTVAYTEIRAAVQKVDRGGLKSNTQTGHTESQCKI
jgi:hypothetical protein